MQESNQFNLIQHTFRKMVADVFQVEIDNDIGFIKQGIVKECSLTETQITNMIRFLNMNQPKLSFMFLLLLCQTKLILQFKKEVVEQWLHTLKIDIPIEIYDKPIYHSDTFSGISYQSNSCYMDSVLLSTFINPSIFDTEILSKNIDLSTTIKCTNNTTDLQKDIAYRKQLQSVLNDISTSLRSESPSVDNVSDLRKAIRHCKGSEDFHKTGTQEASEFLMYLFDKFEVNVATFIKYTYGYNDKKKKVLTSRQEYKDTPLIDIRLDGLNPKNVYVITSFVKQYEKASTSYKSVIDGIPMEFSNRLEITLKKSPVIIFSANRLVDRDHFSKVKLLPPETMFSSYSTLSLSAIVLHKETHAHYVCMFKKNGVWHYYDDSPGKSLYTIKKIGSYEEMISLKTPLTHGTLYYYT